jgi:hypothetical protein
MRQPSKHYNMQHPAVGAVVCPVCHVNAGLPCVTTGKKGNGVEGLRTETHAGRVKLYERKEDSTTFAEREHRDAEDRKLTGE